MDDKKEMNDDISEILKRNKKSDNAVNEDAGVTKAVFGKEDPFAFGSSNPDNAAEDETDLHDIDFDDAEDEESEQENMTDGENINAEEDENVKEAVKQLNKQRQSRHTVLCILLGVIIAAVVIISGARLGSEVLSIILDYTGISTNEYEVEVEIPENPSLSQVIDSLESNGIITEKNIFKMYVEMKGRQNDFVGGTFSLSSAMNYGSIVSTLLDTKTERKTVEVTIIEGMTAAEIGELLEENYVCRAEDFMKFYHSKLDLYDFERRVEQEPLEFNQMEGYLFPDKYEFYVMNELEEDPDGDIDSSKEAETAARKMYSNFDSKITKSMYKKMHEMGLTLDQLITLASIVQAEVGDPEDMKNVASVFLNRMRNEESFPHLESDATVFYVQDSIEPYYDDFDMSASLQAISNAYDTYVADGIPAGPICNPGMDAINAVLADQQTTYYYFCADDDGNTYFASTVEEHEANLAKIQNGE